MRSDNPVKNGGIMTEHAVAGIVLACLAFLIFVRRGLRGLSVPGVGSVSVGR